MSQSQTRGPQWPVIDYSAATAKALEWLGDRYLLATPSRYQRNHVNPFSRDHLRHIVGRPRTPQP